VTKNGLLLLLIEIGIIAAVTIALVSCNFSIPKDIYIHGEHGETTGEETPPPLSGDVTYTNNIAPILNASCLKCHNSNVSSGGQDFSTYESVMNAVVPQNPGDSLLCYELEHGLMPPRGPFLEEDKVKLICDWISDGAKK
jgi:hypothetical protein